jgi:hypothetical protein
MARPPEKWVENIAANQVAIKNQIISIVNYPGQRLKQFKSPAQPDF